LRDFRIAFRVLGARPLFTLVAALSLALGIGANSAIFGLVDTFWLRPLSVPDSGRIARVFSVTEQNSTGLFSYPEYRDLQKQSTALQDLVAIGGRGATLIEGTNRELHNLNLVSPNFFSAMGIKPALGRLFTPQDEADPASALYVVLGNSLWEHHYGGDPNIVGKKIRIHRANDVLCTVIGVLPTTFRGIENGGDRDLWFSLQSWSQIGQPVELVTRSSRWFYVMGRFAPGATEKSANAQLDTIASRMAADFPASNKGRRAAAVSDLRFRMQQAGTNGVALLAIVLVVLLISSVNVANLLLSRAGARGKEMAVRLALGAGRGRLVRQLMTENFLVGMLGLALGIAIGAWLIAVIPVLIVQPPGFHVALDFRFDARVFLFSLFVSLLTIALFGLAPAWKASRPDLVPALKGEAAFGSTSRRWPLRNWLVVAEVAFAMILLASAGVLVHSFANTRTVDLGFGRKPLLLVWTSTNNPKLPVYQEVMTRFEALPGVRSVAGAVRAPLSLSSNGMALRISFPGRTEAPNQAPLEVKYNAVTRNFLSTMGTAIVRGRGFEQRDEMAGANSVIVNEKMAQQYWPGEDAVGKVIHIGGAKGKDHTVIGVARNAPINAVGEAPEPYLYISYWPNIESELTYLVESDGDPAALAQAARQQLKAVSPDLQVMTITTENELIRFSAQIYQITAELVGTLGLLGLILTAVGLYGVVSHGVSQRTRELGVRMALGASRNDTLRLVLRDVAILGLVGLCAGLPLAMAATRFFSKLAVDPGSPGVLFGVSAWDAPAYLAAIVLLSAVVLLAGYIPARRATSVDPSTALRME